MKDWTGNNKTAYANLGASNHSDREREVNDYYATEPSAIDDLFKREHFDDYIWEPSCGEGHLSKRMTELGKEVYSSDLIDRGYGNEFQDFLDWKGGYPTGDIITNPPYKYAQEFCEKALQVTSQKVAMFLKLTFLEGQKRKVFFEKYPPRTIYVFSKRKDCALNGNFKTSQGSAVAYAWFVWEKGFNGAPIIKWI